jgi:hypothetical protein
VRTKFKGSLLISVDADIAAQVSWLSELDLVGVEVTSVSLGRNLSLGVAPAVADLLEAWKPTVAKLSTLNAKLGVRVVLSSAGYESRPSCHVRPNGTRPHNPGDDSPWATSFDMNCQAAAYEALLRAFVGSAGQAPQQPWFAGVFWWLWRGDPTSGGTSRGRVCH